MHHNSVDLVSSESVEGLDKKVRVLVPKGSSLFATHGNRIEL